MIITSQTLQMGEKREKLHFKAKPVQAWCWAVLKTNVKYPKHKSSITLIENSHLKRTSKTVLVVITAAVMQQLTRI
jgi:hypothetical protein